LIGLERDVYESVKETLGKQTVLTYNIDDREFMSNMGSVKMSLKINKEAPYKRKKISFPGHFKSSAQSEL